MSCQEVLLSIQELSVSYLTRTGEHEAVKRVSFELYRGEMLSLVGESGSGKSTLVGAALRTLGPPALITDGAVYYQGVDLLSADEPQLRALRWVSLSLVPQSAMNALNPVMTIAAQLEDTLAAHPWPSALGSTSPEARARELMTLVGLDEVWLNAYPHQLSGGMRQRATIAMALAFNPELIIMDEPTTALDVIVQAEIFEVIGRLRAQLGFSVLLITHDLPLTLSCSDRVGVMRYGELLELDTPSVLLTAPRHPYTQQLIRASASAFEQTSPAERSTSNINMTPTLMVSDVSKRYSSGGRAGDGHLALRGVSFTLHRGEVVAVVGASGSGKSTLGRVICGLEEVTSGQVRLCDPLESERASARAERSRVQMVFQDPFGSLNPVNTIGHHVIRPLRIHHALSQREAQLEAVRLLERVGLSPAEELLSRYPHELSGGQRQRVAIARGLAPRPEVLIADEPTSMLDVSLRAELLQLLRSLTQERGLSLLLITHDLDTARALADRILVLRDGEVVEQGPAQRVLHSPESQYTRALWEATPSLPEPHLPTRVVTREERPDE